MIKIFNFQFFHQRRISPGLTIFKIGIFILVFLIIPFTCQGFFLEEWFEDLEDWVSDEGQNNNTQIINEIKVEANTGGNTADEGEIIEGEEKTSVEIKTIINGQEIEPIDIESSASEVEVESKIEVEQGKEPVVEREIKINNEAVETLTESEIQASVENKGVVEEKIEVVQNWVSNFIENLKLIFLGIFNIF